MIVASLFPPQARARLPLFTLFGLTAAVLRALSALLLVPLLGSLFSPDRARPCRGWPRWPPAWWPAGCWNGAWWCAPSISALP